MGCTSLTLRDILITMFQDHLNNLKPTYFKVGPGKNDYLLVGVVDNVEGLAGEGVIAVNALLAHFPAEVFVPGTKSKYFLSA